METFAGYFTVYSAFPAGNETQARDLQAGLQTEDAPDWRFSLVRSACLPDGSPVYAPELQQIAGSFAWRRIFNLERSWPTTITKHVIPSCGRALSILAKTSHRDVHITFPFACYAANRGRDKLTKSAWAEDPVSIDRNVLHLPFGEPVMDDAEWSIVFIFEPVPELNSTHKLQQQLARLLAQHGHAGQVIIEYEAPGNTEGSPAEWRWFGTVDRRQRHDAQDDAEELFYCSSFCDNAMELGVATRITLNRKIARLVPTHS